MITIYGNKIPKLFFMAAFVLSFHAAKGQSIMQKLKSNNQTSHFAQALEKTDLSSKLNKSGPYTLFAPSNKAFDKLTSTQQENSQLLLNHIFTGMATERSLKAMTEVTCLSGKTIKLKDAKNGQSVSVDSYVIIAPNIRASNGVIHIINGVIK
ncbi:MAG TPA: fasciclin domain-containing protein [Balneolaceae bacterium]|nr:fasciclin domain-containing protein [Balneolaceae bacterium]